ncbi:formate dehydrogenase accessory sulfurtransferase FdhD [Nocardia transvalensis]|uniref:formate dehydrogenase accessory sulfurtransferase FdhD n=1 Tax=Nocardia transvalensis TaxID=37333 RepID=UPI0018943AD8|nr:formate dehydrogenase accessory sulfurtransferase FdhD [Nocardia transvalensis]MBF6331540.1 formate dehydrogenase accessory sulfurtransferase FdhD [Nocardia transvalensis]
MSRVTARRRTLRISPAGQIRRPDTLAVEEPLELRVDGQSLTVTMRTPGSDIDLAHGFLLSENIIGSREDIVSARYCAGTDENGQNTYNVLDIRLRTPAPILSRNFLTTSACGLCGKTALDEVRTRTRFPLTGDGPLVDAEVLAALPDRLRSRQTVFDATGGLHAAGLFTAEGAALAVREDVGRHNAVDKVIGWALRENRVPAHDLVLIVSGRASFELVQKAVMAGIPILGAVSAPSSLAVDLAAESDLTLAGFLRGDTMNVYTGAHRLSTATNGVGGRRQHG